MATISFNNIFYSVGNKMILNDVSGKVYPGEFVALMGPSGSGKTTLLNILGGRSKRKKRGIHLNGEYMIDGNLPRKKEIGFVLQHDVMFPTLTVRDMLIFTMAIRHPKISKEDQQKRIEELAKLLCIDNILDTRIGSEKNGGISGGEKRRVNICNELLAFPKVIFLDEPTSGLDTATAVRLLRILKTLTKTGITVVFSIHQPPAQTYKLFDRLLFILDGHMVYCGSPIKLNHHVKSLGINKDPYLNSADQMMTLVLEEEDDHYKNLFISSAFCDKQKIEEKNKLTLKENIVDLEQGIVYSEKSRRVEIGLLAKRSLLHSFWSSLDVIENLSLIFRSFFMGAIWFSAFLYVYRILEAPGIVYMALVLASFFMPSFSGIFTFACEERIVEREIYTGTYSMSSYYIGKIIGEFPCLLIRPTYSLIIFYWMVGLKRTVGGFFFAFITIILNTIVSNAMGLIIAITSKDVNQGTHIMEGLLMILSFVAGFWARFMPIWLSWFAYLSPLSYSYQALLLNEFEGKSYLGDGKVVYNSLPSNETIIIQGKDVLEDFTIWFDNKWIYIILLGVWYIIFRLIAYISLKLHLRQKNLCTCS